jgi:hypothetical protein
MPIPITCPKCQASGFVPDQALHQNATCPVCQITFVVAGHLQASPAPRVARDWVDPMTVAPDFPAGSGAFPPALGRSEHSPSDTPPSKDAADSVGTADWLRIERVKFDTYVANQLARLDLSRRENASAESLHEAACIRRSMELNRREAELEARRKELELRETEVRSADAALRARSEAVEGVAAGLAEREAAVIALESRCSELQSEAASLSAIVAELRPVVEQLELRKTEALTIQAEIKSKQSALDRRLIEVGRNELAIQKRLQEFQEMERSVQYELEAREADLERQRATLLEEVRSLRGRLPVDGTPPPRMAKPNASRLPSDESDFVIPPIPS